MTEPHRAHAGLAHEPTEHPGSGMTGTSKTGAIGWGAALIAVAAGVGFYLLVHQPTVRKTTNLEQSISEVRQHEATARDRAETLEQQLAALSRERDALRTERDGLAAETGRLSTTVQEREAELARMGAAQVSLESQLADEIRSGAIVVENVGGELKVKLNDEILFSSGETELTAQGQEVLRRLAQSLTSLEEGLIEVGGHTDSTPVSDRIRERFATNWELSANRATNVVRFLQDECNIPGRRLAAVGYGQFRPVANNRSATGRGRNRRIEFTLRPRPTRDQVAAAAVSSETTPAAAPPAAPTAPAAPATATPPAATH